MTYKWNGDTLHTVFALPAAVADDTLRLAGAVQLKVLLWFARGGGAFDPAACGAAIGQSPTDCADAMQFWVETGILTASGECAPEAPKAVVSAPPVLPPLSVKQSHRPQFPDVVARQKGCPDFDYLLKTAEQRLGRPLTHGEMETFLYIYDTLGLPVEVILMMLVDVVHKGKVRVKSGFKSYLEKVAVSWAEQGITTIAAAEQALCREERRDAAREHIQTLFKLDRTPNLLQVEAAVQWIDEWHFSDEVLLVAYEQCRERTGKFQATYMTRMLESWHADGITTAEQARAASEPKRKSTGKPLQADDEAPAAASDEYEQAAASYRPVYKKAGK